MLNYAYIGIADLFSGKLATACPKFVHNELNIFFRYGGDLDTVCCGLNLMCRIQLSKLTSD